MSKNTQLKQQAQMIKAAFEEGWKQCMDWYVDTDFAHTPKERMEMDWKNSTAKEMHDQLLMEAKSSLTTKTFADIWAEL